MNMDYNFCQINSILDAPKNKIIEFLNEFDNFMHSSKELRKDYNIINNSNFNIFSSISDIYYRENLHSDILRLILDPLTEKIGNPKNIQLFIKLLKKIKPELKIEIGKNISIERETGRIDILIYDEKNNAIIIENKINFADDQDDQLGRYFLTVTKKGLLVKAIVYITLIPEKLLDIEYSIRNEELRSKIKDIIIPVSVINKKNEISFSGDFINKCILHSKNDISKVYYSEYNELITCLGGNCMTMDLDRDAIMEIYADKDKLSKFNMFGSLWDKREEVIKDIINDQLKENDFEIHPDDKKNTLYYKIDDDISLGYHLKDFSFGFVCTPGTKNLSKKQEDLKIILDNKKLKNIFTKEPAESYGSWAWKTIDIDKIGNFENIITNFKLLEKLYSE
jgi:hypothetical protein